MSKIEDIADMEFGKLLEHVDLGELDIAKSHLHRQDTLSDELLGVVLALEDDMLSTLGMAHIHDGRCGELCLGNGWTRARGPLFLFPTEVQPTQT